MFLEHHLIYDHDRQGLYRVNLSTKLPSISNYVLFLFNFTILLQIYNEVEKNQVSLSNVSFGYTCIYVYEGTQFETSFKVEYVQSVNFNFKNYLPQTLHILI